MRPEKNAKTDNMDFVFANKVNGFVGFRLNFIENLINLKFSKPKELGVLKLEIIHRDIKRKILVNENRLNSD